MNKQMKVMISIGSGLSGLPPNSKRFLWLERLVERRASAILGLRNSRLSLFGPSFLNTTEFLYGVVGVLVLALSFFVELFYNAAVTFVDIALFPL